MLASQKEDSGANTATAQAAQFCLATLATGVDISGPCDAVRDQHAAMEDRIEQADRADDRSDVTTPVKDCERESGVKEKPRRRREQKKGSHRKNDKPHDKSNVTSDFSSDEEKLHNFMLKGVSLGYDHKTVLSALRHVSSETTISGFVEALIRCEEQNNDIDKRYNCGCRREQKSLEYPTEDTQAILDGADIEAAYRKDQSSVAGRGLQIAFAAVQNLNFRRCIVVFTKWTLFAESYQRQGFVEELVKSNSLISLAEEPPEVVAKILKHLLETKSVVFSRGCSDKSLLHLLKAHRHILPLGRQVTVACYHFDFDRFVIEGWNFPLKGKNAEGDSCLFETGGSDAGSTIFPPAELCPYGNKCTYGNKCKYYHPERGTLEQISLTEQLIRKAHVEREKLEESFREKGSLSAIVSEKGDNLKRTCDQNGNKEEQNIGRFAIEKCSNGDSNSLPSGSRNDQNVDRLRTKALVERTSSQEETQECHPPKLKQGHRTTFLSGCCNQYPLNGKILPRERKDAAFANSFFAASQQAVRMNYQPLPMVSGNQRGFEHFVLPDNTSIVPPVQSFSRKEADDTRAGKQIDGYEGNYFTWSANGQWPQQTASSVWPRESEAVFYHLPAIHQTSSADTLYSLGKSPAVLPRRQRNNSRPPLSSNGTYHLSLLGSHDPDGANSCVYADGINFADASPFSISDGTDGPRLNHGSLNCMAGPSAGLERAYLKYNAKPSCMPSHFDEQNGPYRTVYTMTSDLGSSTFSNSSRSLSLSSSLSSSLNAVSGSISDLSIRDGKSSFFKPKSDWHLCRDNSDKWRKPSSRSSTDLATIHGTCVKTEVASPVANPYREIAESLEHFEHPGARFHNPGPTKPFSPGFSTVYEHDLGQLRQA